MGVELRELIGQDVPGSLDVGKVPADQVGHEIMSAPGSKEDLAALFRRQGREFVEEAISGLFQAVKELRFAKVG